LYIGFKQFDDSDSKEIFALEVVEKWVGYHEDDAVHEEEDVVALEKRFG
jgi:hypothetical protein